MATIPMDVEEQYTPSFLIHAYCSPSLQSLWSMSVIPKCLSLVIITTFMKTWWIENYSMMIHGTF